MGVLFFMWEYIIGLFALLRALTGIRFFLIKRRVKGYVSVIPEAQPILKRVSGRKAALLIHGFTSSPREFRGLSEYLAKKGISSYAPLLAGHGTAPERLAVIKHYQLVEDVRSSIDKLSKEFNEIYLVGNSFGGNLALICSDYSPKIKGIITLAAPIYFRRHKISKYVLLPILRRIKLFQRKPKHVRDFIDKHNGSYRVVPLRAAYEMSKILEISKKELPKIKKPILAVHVKNDNVVSNESHEYILNNVSSKKKYSLEIPESNHVFLLDKYAHVANREILRFIRKN